LEEIEQGTKLRHVEVDEINDQSEPRVPRKKTETNDLGDFEGSEVAAHGLFCMEPQRLLQVVEEKEQEYLKKEVYGEGEWGRPRMVLRDSKKARPGYHSGAAHEYHDLPSVLSRKISILASLIRSSSYFTIYSGAGISTTSGTVLCGCL